MPSEKLTQRLVDALPQSDKTIMYFDQTLKGFGVYAKYEPAKPSYPAMFKLYQELTSCMKNGWKVIQAISKLPSSDLTALKRIISTCKESK